MSTRLSHAKLFENSYIKFQLPYQWGCGLKNTVWVCRYKISTPCKKNPKRLICKKEIKKSKEAVIIFAAKEASKVDNLKTYFEILGKTRKVKKRSGQTVQSKVIHTKVVNIKQHKWVDGMHLGSEIPHYYTRYLATVKGNVAVLITFSSHKLFYTGYSNQFFRAINSLLITNSKVSKIQKNEIGQKVFSHPLDISHEIFEKELKGNGSSEGNTDTFLFLFAIIIASIGIYIWVKSDKGV